MSHFILGRAIDAASPVIPVSRRFKLEEEIVYVNFIARPSRPGEWRLKSVQRGMEGTTATDHPEGTELVALGAGDQPTEGTSWALGWRP